MMSRNIMSASSTSSTCFLGPRSTEYTGQFNIWNVVARKTLENAFCMTSKFRVRAKIHRIKTTKVERRRYVATDNEQVRAGGDVTSSSSDVSQEWDDYDEAEDDLVELYRELTENATKASAVGAIVTQSRRYSVNRPFSGIESDVIAEVAGSGTTAQKLYLRKCADFLITPSRIFVKALPTTVVNIGHQNIGPQGAEACAISLTKTRTVRVLNLDDNGIGTRGAKFIALMLKENKFITDLSLSDNEITGKGAKYLISVIMETDKIQRLTLSNNGFKEKDAEIFKQLLEETRNLHYLNLSHNEFREAGGVMLGEALSYNDGLEELDLSWNHLRRDGAVGLIEGIMDNTSLKTLTLALNGFYLEGCIALQKTLLYNTTLEVLDLTNNRINRECIEQLSHGLAKNTTLHTLILKCNPLTCDGAHDVLQFLADSPTSGVKLVDFGIQQVDPHCLALINEVHLQGRKLKVIHGHVLGEMRSRSVELERNLIEEHPALVLIEFGKLMGFRLVDLFSSLDKDGSRTLDKDEIRTGLRMANVPFSDECIDLLIRKLDVNQDGEIDFSELLLAQQQHRDAVMKMMEAELSGGVIRIEDTPLWKIRTRLMKLMAEKMSDFSAFKRMSDQIAQQVQRANDELEAKREAAARERSRRPRKVRSRPVSSTQPVSNTDTADDPKSPPNTEHHEEQKTDDVIESGTRAMSSDDVTDDVTADQSTVSADADQTSVKPKQRETNRKKDSQTTRHVRKRSVQLPIRMPYHTSAEDFRQQNHKSTDILEELAKHSP